VAAATAATAAVGVRDGAAAKEEAEAAREGAATGATTAAAGLEDGEHGEVVGAVDSTDASDGSEAAASAPREAEEQPLDAFVVRVCARIGRSADDAAAITAKLRTNWFESPRELDGVSLEQVAALGIPARFGQEMARTLAEDAEEEEARRYQEAWPNAGADAVAAAAAAAAAAQEGWVGGALPGPDARMLSGHGNQYSRSDGAVALASVRVTKRRR
jgi:hypothetical protein